MRRFQSHINNVMNRDTTVCTDSIRLENDPRQLMVEQLRVMRALTELLGVLGEGHGSAVVVGVHDPGLRVLAAEPLQLLLEHGVVVLREVVVRLEAADGVVVAPVLARVQGQVRRRAADRQVARHHQVPRAGSDQFLRQHIVIE